MNPKLILASSSKFRVSLLEQIGYIPDQIYAPDIDETPFKKELPKKISQRLAQEKAIKASSLFENDIVIAADTVASVGSLILPKALTEEDALFCIKKLSGRRHRVYTTVCGIHKGKCITKTSTSIIKFKRLSDQEIKLFIESKDWYGKAGGYALQGLASAFIIWMRGSHTNITGLPLYETYLILSSFGSLPNLTTKPKV